MFKQQEFFRKQEDLPSAAEVKEKGGFSLYHPICTLKALLMMPFETISVMNNSTQVKEKGGFSYVELNEKQSPAGGETVLCL